MKITKGILIYMCAVPFLLGSMRCELESFFDLYFMLIFAFFGIGLTLVAAYVHNKEVRNK